MHPRHLRLGFDIAFGIIITARAIHLALLRMQAHDEKIADKIFLLQIKQNGLFSSRFPSVNFCPIDLRFFMQQERTQVDKRIAFLMKKMGYSQGANAVGIIGNRFCDRLKDISLSFYPCEYFLGLVLDRRRILQPTDQSFDPKAAAERSGF
jgi:hypothetical protein